MAQAQAQRRGGAEQREERQPKHHACVRKGVVRGAQQASEIMCGRFVSVRLCVKEVKWHVSSCTFFFWGSETWSWIISERGDQGEKSVDGVVGSGPA